MEAYKRWVRRNKDYVHSLESLANGLTWLLPERFSNSEIGPEAVTSIFGVLTSINEHIISTTPTKRSFGHVEPLSFPHSLCITLLKDVETLVEVVAQQLYGEENKWNLIAVIEAIKVLLRLTSLRNTGYKMLLRGGETINDMKSSDALNTQNGYGHITMNGQNQGPASFVNNHEQNPCSLQGRALSALNRFGENARMVSEPAWLRRVQHQHVIMEPPAVVAKRPTLSTILSDKGVPGGFFVMGEVMFIIRPLVYVLLIRKYGIRSWFPWLTSLMFDLISMGNISLATSSWSYKKGQHYHLAVAEKDEMRRRKLLWALYLMRDPFFSKYTRKRVESTEKALEPIPFIGFLTAKLIELLIGAQTRYTYISGS